MILRTITIAVLAVWLFLVLLGKSGFVHVLILTGVGIGFVDALRSIRSRKVTSE